MVNSEIINKNIEYINNNIKNTILIKNYKQGIIGINKESNFVYLDLEKYLTKQIKLDCEKFYLDCIKVNENENICFIVTTKHVLIIDLHDFTIKSTIDLSDKDLFFLSNLCYYKNGNLLGIKKNELINYNIYNKEKKIVCNNLGIKFYSFKDILNDIFYFVSDKILYTYNITNNCLLQRKTIYVNVNDYGIYELDQDSYVITLKIHTCVCIYSINKTRDKCFIGHFSPKFENIKQVMNDIKSKLEDSYDDMKIQLLGGNNQNRSYNYLQTMLLPEYNYKKTQHVLKPYSLMISKKKTIIF